MGKVINFALETRDIMNFSNIDNLYTVCVYIVFSYRISNNISIYFLSVTIFILFYSFLDVILYFVFFNQ